MERRTTSGDSSASAEIACAMAARRSSTHLRSPASSFLPRVSASVTGSEAASCTAAAARRSRTLMVVSSIVEEPSSKSSTCGLWRNMAVSAYCRNSAASCCALDLNGEVP